MRNAHNKDEYSLAHSSDFDTLPIEAMYNTSDMI